MIVAPPLNRRLNMRNDTVPRVLSVALDHPSNLFGFSLHTLLENQKNLPKLPPPRDFDEVVHQPRELVDPSLGEPA